MVNGKPGRFVPNGTITQWSSSFPSRTISSWTSWRAYRHGRRPGHPAVQRPHHGRLHASALPEAVPAEVCGQGRPGQESQGDGFRRLGEPYQEPVGLAPESRTLRSSAHGRLSPRSTPRPGCMERNPYYYGIDSEGNQLPYIDQICMALAENLEVLNLRAIAGGVRPAGAPHRSIQAPGLPGEPGQRQLRRSPRPGPERVRRHAADQPQLTRQTLRSLNGSILGTSDGHCHSASTATS